MATENPEDSEERVYLEDMASLDSELAEARESLSALTDAASAATHVTDNSQADYSLHEVTGVGRYAIPRLSGWRALLKVIHTPRANIDFSSNGYPAFDAIIGEHFASPYLLDPLNDNFESYKGLRDNLAAVRNFLMQSYYVNTPPGMTPEKAQKALEEIAAYVGDGLDNNDLFLGIIRTHNRSKPFIDLNKAMEPGGEGAQYIYEKILEMHRHSSWMRPFDAIKELFGGKPAPDWMLPAAHETGFTDLVETDIAEKTPPAGPAPQALEAEIAHINALEAARTKRMDQYTVNLSAHDLDALGNHLFQTVNNLNSVQNLSEPVRRDAIEIAKDILRKLRVTLGDINIAHGLQLPPNNAIATFGDIKGVSIIYERMVQWARNIDGRIMQDASVIAATQAIGQMGYLAKLEAQRMANVAGNRALSAKITAQLQQVPEVYRTDGRNKPVSALLSDVEAGINTILNRVQTLQGPGMQVGLSGNALGGVSQPPTAGQANNSLAKPPINDAAKLNNNLVTSLQQTQVKTATQTKNVWSTQTTTKTTSPQWGSPTLSGNKRPVTQLRSNSTSSTAIVNPFQQSQRQQNRINQMHLHHDHEQEEAEKIAKQQQEAQRIAAYKATQKAAVKTTAKQEKTVVQQKDVASKEAAAKAAAAAANLDKGMLEKFKNGMDTKGMKGPAINPGSEGKSFVATVKPVGVPARPDDNFPPLPPAPNKGGRSF